MWKAKASWLLSALAGLGLALGGEDEPTPLQKALRDTELAGTWIHNDAAAGFAEAKKTGKPLLMVFR